MLRDANTWMTLNPTEFLSRTGYRLVSATTSSVLSPGATINGVLFTGASPIVVTAAAGTLSGATLASNVLASSLTSVGTLSGLTVTATITGSISGNAATVTTNANLTGDVTSVGNATTIKTNVGLAGSPTTTTQSQGTSNTTISTTAYVDTAVANAIAGVNPAVAVQAATTTASDTSGLTYNNGVSGVGATFTGTTNTALVVDGYTFTMAGQRLLVKNDTQSANPGAYNGIYYVTQLQTALLPPILTRALDYDQPSDINNTGAIPVISGTVNGSTSWVQTAQIVTVGTTPLAYTQFSVNPTTLLSNSLSSGNIFVGSAGGVATGVAMSGNATITNAGVVSVSSAATVATISGLITNGTNVTISGAGTSGSPYSISASGGSADESDFDQSFLMMGG